MTRITTFMENPVIIFGAKALGRSVLDLFNRNGVIVFGFLDDDEALHGTEINEISVLGSTQDEGFTKLIGKKCEAFVAVEDSSERKHIVEMLKNIRHVMPVNAIHDRATVSEAAAVGHGNLIGAGALVGANARVGNHCLIHTGAIIETDAQLADFVQVGARAVVGAGVSIGANAFVGTGAVVIAGVSLGKNASIGAGSVVIENVPDGARVFGNPAKKL
jgi:sugar O-acyltransferase (sialic acid O-acetyltransferase NeuD family)